MVYLGGVEGEFRLPHPRPEKLLFISAGSGDHADLEHGPQPRRATARSATRSTSTAAATPTTSSSARRCASCADAATGYELHEHHSSRPPSASRPTDLDELVPGLARARGVPLGPARDARGDEGALGGRGRPRAAPPRALPAGDRRRRRRRRPARAARVRFRVTEVEAECDGRTPILGRGENAGAKLPFGCRMGICHTCVGKLAEGKVRDLRTGEVHGEEGQMIRTCVNAPEGHVEIEL